MYLPFLIDAFSWKCYYGLGTAKAIQPWRVADVATVFILAMMVDAFVEDIKKVQENDRK